MSIIKKRILAYLFLSLGLAFALGPYTFKKKEDFQGPVLYLSALVPKDKILTKYCSKGIKKINSQELSSFPKIKALVDQFLVNVPFRYETYVKSPKLSLFLAKFEEKSSRKGFCFSCSGKIFYLKSSTFFEDSGQMYLVSVSDSVMLNKLKVPVEMRHDPLWQTYVDSLLKKPSKSMRSSEYVAYRLKDPPFKPQRSKISPENWQKYLNQAHGKTGDFFEVQGFLVKGHVEEIYETISVEVAWLLYLRLALGLLFLAWGFTKIKGAYGKNPGISVNPSWVGKFSDTMFILFVTAGAYALIEHLQLRLFGVFPFLDDEAVRVVMSFMYLPVLIFCAFYSSNISGQSLEVTEKGVIRHGPGGAKAMSWENIKKIGLRETTIPLIRAGIALPRHFQTKLVIFGQDDDLELFEPAQKNIKRNIAETITRFSPERLHKDIKEVEENW